MHMALPETRHLPSLSQSSAALLHQPPQADVAWEEALLQSREDVVDASGVAAIAPSKSVTPEVLFPIVYEDISPQVPTSFVSVEVPLTEIHRYTPVPDILAPEVVEQLPTKGPIPFGNKTAMHVSGLDLSPELASTAMLAFARPTVTAPLHTLIDGSNQALEPQVTNQTDLLPASLFLKERSTVQDDVLHESPQQFLQNGNQSATQIFVNRLQRTTVANTPPLTVKHAFSNASKLPLRDAGILQTQNMVQPMEIEPTLKRAFFTATQNDATAKSSPEFNEPLPVHNVRNATTPDASGVAQPIGTPLFETPAPNPSPTALTAPDMQIPPKKGDDPLPPTLSLKEIIYTPSNTQPVQASGAMRASIALVWGLGQDLSLKDAAKAQYDGVLSDLRSTFPAATDQAAPSSEVIDQPVDLDGFTHTVIAPTFETAVSLQVSIAEPEMDPERTDVEGVRLSSGRSDAQIISHSPPSAVEQAKAALMTQAIKEGPGTIELTLTPDDLGALRFEMKQDAGGLTIVLSAERPETLDLMRRNVADLIAELKEAGVQTGSFGFGAWSDRPPSSETPTPEFAGTTADAPSISPQPQALRPTAQVPGGLDLRF